MIDEGIRRLKADPELLIIEWNFAMSPFPEATEVTSFRDYVPSSFGMQAPKGSELTGFMSYWVNRFHEAGIIKVCVQVHDKNSFG